MSRITLPLMEVMYCNGLDDIAVDIKKTQDLLEQAKANIILAQQRQKKAYDRKHSNLCCSTEKGLHSEEKEGRKT